ncbi:SNF2 family N-terminal domain-containing protein [Podospora fimiseda]|uniref:SNF2 family N-terminal domain-containing protein n=1 Tax=Podospora fimiseda TaxID=252190 RepID=A0AAN6YP86_9PEZI|nr:SNF2 family N-terminal domain-containing protein [Podospora fimiseda]
MHRKRRRSQASYSDINSPQSQRNVFLTVNSSFSNVSSPSSLSEHSTSLTPAPQLFTTSNAFRDAWSADQICFGTLNDIKILLKWFPKSTESLCGAGTLDDRDGNAVRILNLGFHGDYCLVHTEAGDAVGTLEERAFKCLAGLVQGKNHVQVEALVSESEWQAKINSIHNRKGQQVTVDLELFGPRSSAEDVARRLGPPYENPQCLDIHIEERHNDDEDLTARNEGDGSRTNFQPLNNFQDSEDIIPDLDELMSTLYQEDDMYLGELLIDLRISTTLLEHQIRALKFILGRESGLTTDARSLWDPLGQDHDIIGYRHAITGAKSRTADDSPGGIIADDMGLGKTLTMLSAILTSSFHAFEYVSSNQPADPESGEEVRQGGPLYVTATLVVMPSEYEIKRHTLEDSVFYYKYHGKERHKDPRDLSKYEIVLTTYGTIAAEAARGQNTLDRIHWYRVILDEAHTIRNWTTKQFSAVYNLHSHIRWCMTGTPIQNKLDDLGALVRFLRIPILDDVTVFRRYISSEAELTKHKAPDFSNIKLLLQSICLRRSKSQLGLNYKTEVIRPIFSDSERGGYQTLDVIFRDAILKSVNSKRTKASHQNVLEKLLRLREFCNGILTDAAGANAPERIFSMMRQTGETMCYYCTVTITDVDIEGSEAGGRVCLTECHRFVCGDSSCFSQYTCDLGVVDAVTGRQTCPFCKVQHGTTNLLTQRSGGLNEEMGLDSASVTSCPSKLLALLEDVKLHIDQEKCIIFSVWKRTLSLVERLLSQNDIRYCRVDGSVSTTNKRKKILLEFQQDPQLKVLLMTLGTGAVGLNNLSVASRIHLLEPQWNPSVERQAIGRVLRLGQEREVKIIRYIMKNSIEEVRIIILKPKNDETDGWYYFVVKLVEGRQRHKLHIASGGFKIAELVREGLNGHDASDVAMVDG